MALVLVYLRGDLEETVSDEVRHRKEAGSLHVLLKHKRPVLLLLAVTVGGSLYFYTFTFWSHRSTFLRRPRPSSWPSTWQYPCCRSRRSGALSDRIGIKRNMHLFTGLGTAATVPLLISLSTVSSAYAAFALVLYGFVIASFYTPTAGLAKANLPAPEVRALGVGLPCAIAKELFGSTAEYIALSLKSHGAESPYFYYVSAVLVVSFAAALWMPDLRTKAYLDGAGEIEP